MTDIPDELTERVIKNAGRLMELRLLSAPRNKIAEKVFTQTAGRVETYQLLCALSALIGEVLRPKGHDGGPLGPGAEVVALADRMPHYRRAGWKRACTAAAVIIGFGAQMDADMVRALALAEVSLDAPPESSRRTVLAMLEIFANEPVVPTTESDPS